MPRPCKCRRICSMPTNLSLGPCQDPLFTEEALVMTLDEYEAIRLIDLEGLSQAACAQRMNVARTTAQAIYNNARLVLARCLVEGKVLCVQGGSYELCQGGKTGCGCCPDKPSGINN